MAGTDEQISTGVRGLATALAPPVDAAERVSRRIAQRRRRRRTIATTATVAVIAGSGITLVGLLGGDEDPDGVAVDPAGSSGSVLLTRPDGSTHRFDEISVDCGSGSTGRRTVSAQSPRRLGGDRLLQPWFYLEANLGELEVGRTYELPLSGDSDRLPLIAFVADTAAEGGRSNEVSSAQPGAGGTMRVLEASCGRTPTLRFQLDATLGSEVSRGPLDVAGSSE
jgi:hypothetical protein